MSIGGAVIGQGKNQPRMTATRRVEKFTQTRGKGSDQNPMHPSRGGDVGDLLRRSANF